VDSTHFGRSVPSYWQKFTCILRGLGLVVNRAERRPFRHGAINASLPSLSLSLSLSLRTSVSPCDAFSRFETHLHVSSFFLDVGKRRTITIDSPPLFVAITFRIELQHAMHRNLEVRALGWLHPLQVPARAFVRRISNTTSERRSIRPMFL